MKTMALISVKDANRIDPDVKLYDPETGKEVYVYRTYTNGEGSHFRLRGAHCHPTQLKERQTS